MATKRRIVPPRTDDVGELQRWYQHACEILNSNAYGSLYLHEGAGNVDISTAGQGVYVKITGFTTGLLNGATINSDAFNVDIPGVYKVYYKVSGDSAGVNKIYEVDSLRNLLLVAKHELTFLLFLNLLLMEIFEQIFYQEFSYHLQHTYQFDQDV